ncbi:MAG: YaiI/YqxD family protein [Gammaproteobacteria bacterium]|nr:YaiI/YqxD family protein [Gammaproteobacteria bacterium]
MHIWIDADACPGPVKDIVFRASRRVGVAVTLVANRPLTLPRSPLITAVHVGQGFDEADDYLARQAESGDLVITADIPLAARLVARDIAVLNPRGEAYSTENIQERLALRDLKEALRSAGAMTGGPAPYHNRDKQAFANSLDRWLAQHRPTHAR